MLIADDLRQRIESGTRPGEQLPNEKDLGEQYRASRNTVREAIRWLINRGLVEPEIGTGNVRAPEDRAVRHDPVR